MCPDWITECVKNTSKVVEDRYHPRLLNLTPPPTPPKPPTPEPPQLPPPQLTPKLEPKLEPGTLHMTMPLQHMSTTTHQQQHQQQQQQLQQQHQHQHHYGYPPHYASPYAVQAGILVLLPCVHVNGMLCSALVETLDMRFAAQDGRNNTFNCL